MSGLPWPGPRAFKAGGLRGKSLRLILVTTAVARVKGLARDDERIVCIGNVYNTGAKQKS
jgi:hypothetical protein